MEIKINVPFNKGQEVRNLKMGDRVLISGTIYTARDAAHKRLIELLNKGEELPIELLNQVIYYVGPTPAKPGEVIGSAGPTSSYRMDTYSTKLIELGLKGMIGKGLRSQEVIDAIIKNGAVYFGAIGGAAALIAKSIKKSEVIAYEDLGAEAIRKLEVKDFPAIVVIDSDGNNLYKDGRNEYLKSFK
ncbi:fumarate hydratase subunit beta [Clostridium acidisoli DSM 12555]|uniref:Fumarate hydratase subunit beta n=1 Tax=Clostridium acidisoli DSM 12555 TaxID=1121291 RepID=A0A1W1XYY7_9CLOT|nr:Fe-S-containing hydro-lyase [Clostridium acidisoli]SMC28718.1 fumarate hydratase subunit beta [Clostridium acidisoli DSM 12555]